MDEAKLRSSRNDGELHHIMRTAMMMMMPAAPSVLYDPPTAVAPSVGMIGISTLPSVSLLHHHYLPTLSTAASINDYLHQQSRIASAYASEDALFMSELARRRAGVAAAATKSLLPDFANLVALGGTTSMIPTASSASMPSAFNSSAYDWWCPQPLLGTTTFARATLPTATAASETITDRERMRLGMARFQTGMGAERDTFPTILHRALTHLEHVVGGAKIATFLPEGTSFQIRSPFLFGRHVLPILFPNMKGFASFQRQLNLYDFKRIGGLGADRGGYCHPLFVRDNPASASEMKRTKIKGDCRRGSARAAAAIVAASKDG
jgi:hypothetical protein